MDYDRESLEAMRTMDRPRVRCRIDAAYTNQDGGVRRATRDTTGRIVVDGNNPWVEVHAASIQHAERFSWGLVLEVLNDKYAAPIHFGHEFQYEE